MTEGKNKRREEGKNWKRTRPAALGDGLPSFAGAGVGPCIRLGKINVLLYSHCHCRACHWLSPSTAMAAAYPAPALISRNVHARARGFAWSRQASSAAAAPGSRETSNCFKGKDKPSPRPLM